MVGSRTAEYRVCRNNGILVCVYRDPDDGPDALAQARHQARSEDEFYGADAPHTVEMREIVTTPWRSVAAPVSGDGDGDE
jgi:hypothetical protein